MSNRTLLARIAGCAILLLTAAPIQGIASEDDPQAIAAKAFELRMDGQVENAVQFLENGIADHPQAGVLHYELARARLLLLEIPAMQKEAEEAIRCAPDDAEYHYFTAMVSAYSLIDAAHHQDQEQMKVRGQQSLDELTTVLKIDPNHHQARYLLVQLGTDMAPEVGLKVEGTENHVRLLEEEDPILGAKARCCLVNADEQRKIWKRVLSDHPDDARALSEAAEGLISVGALKLAAECLDKAIQQDETNAYGLLRLSTGYGMKNDWGRAAEVSRRYLEYDQPIALKAFAMHQLAVIHKRMGDEAKGRELLDQARELDPHVWQTFMPPPKEIFTSPL